MNFLLVGDEAGNFATMKLLSKAGFESHTFYCWAPSVTIDLQENCHQLPTTSSIGDFTRLCSSQKIDYVILTSEKEVHSGIANAMQSLRIPCFGPSRVSSHFRFDSAHFESLLLSANLQPMSDLFLLEGEKGSKGVYVGMAASGQAIGVGITPGLCERTTTNIVSRLINEISLVDATYNGWIVLELLQTSTGIYVGAARCFPPADYLINLSHRPGFDFLSRLRTLLAPESRNFNFFRQQVTQVKEIAI